MRQVMFDWTGAFRAQVDPTETPREREQAAEPSVSSASRMAGLGGEAMLIDDAGETAMTREQVLERIVSLNPTAGETFLEHFGDDHLRNYLDRLVGMARPRGRDARWVRRPESRAAMMHVRLV
jgi:hypothetical protein